MQISLVAEVAANYLTLAADRELLKLAKDTLMSQQASYQLISKRYESGVSSALDLYQAQISVDTARVDVNRFTTLVARDENALNLVAGSTVPSDLLPGALSEMLNALKDLPPGLPSDVLLSRPDILEAEALLKAAHANIGVARAASRITLVSSVGFGSDDLIGLFTDGSSVWQFAILWFADVTASILLLGSSHPTEGMVGFPLAITLNANFTSNQKEGKLRAVATFVKKGKKINIVRTIITGADDRLIADVTTNHVSAK